METKINTEVINNETPLWKLTVGQFRELVKTLPNNNNHPPDAPLQDLMRLKDVLVLLKISRSTLFSWKKQRVITGHTIRGTLFFKKTEIMQLFENNKLKSK